MYDNKYRQVSAIAAGLTLLLATRPVAADEIPQKYGATVDKGLQWLIARQCSDGRWEGNGGQWTVPLTALSGMALLMEGSTVREGKYHDPIRRARDWLLKRQRPSGLIADPRLEHEGIRYMHGHGFATLFLACLVGEEEDASQRAQLVEVVGKACQFSWQAQTKRGGWGYVSAKDGANHDEGSVTITQVQALRAARNAGVVVSAEAIQEAVKYLRNSTNERGGIIYSLGQAGGVAQGQGRPALTAAAVACGFSAGEYDSPAVKKWLRFCQETIPLCGDGRRFEHHEYTHYYYAQAVYVLGDDRWRELFPEAKPGEQVTWSKYRATLFDEIAKQQSSDGGWPGLGSHPHLGIGPVLTAACYLTILQLDKAVLPIYQR